MESEDKVENSTRNPEDMIIKVFAGADGSFNMYEDKEDEEEQSVRTNMGFQWGNQSQFTIEGVNDKLNVIPGKRNYEIGFAGIDDISQICVESGEEIGRAHV